MIIGIDPGKNGAICILHSDSTPLKAWPMPKIGAKIDQIAVKKLIAQIVTFISGQYLGLKIEVAIEKTYAHSKKYSDVDNDNAFFSFLRGLISEAGADDETVKLIISHCREWLLSRNLSLDYADKIEGITSMHKYGKEAGKTIGICLGLGLKVEEIYPRTWQAEMFKSLDKNMRPKEKALMAYKNMWPDKEHLLYVGKRTKHHDGIVDGFLIAEYFRREMRR